jgi:hypothetical protein
MAKSASSSKRPRVPDRAPSRTSPGKWWILGGIALAGLIVAASQFRGTGEAEQGNQVVSESGASAPAELLRRVAEKYRTMTSYAEHVEVRVRLPVEGQIVEEVTISKHAMQLPNQFRIDVRNDQRGLQLASDATELVATVTDPATENFANQYVQRPAPPQLELPAIYGATEFTDVNRPNELLYLLTSFTLDLQISPIGLLVSQSQWSQLLKDARAITALPNQSVDGVDCHRIRVEVPVGDFVFHVGIEDDLIRRIEYPVGSLLAPDTPVEQRTEASIVSTHKNLRVNEALSKEEFAITRPTTGKRMRHFVLPFTEQAPQILHAKPESFSFTDLDGNAVSSTDWQDKIVVLVWFTDHPASQALLTQIDRVRTAQPADSPSIYFAVCTEPPSEKSHTDVANITRRWQVSLPVVRDLDAVGRDEFQIHEAPTLVILDRTGSVQLFEVGVNPELEQQLPAVLDELKSGKDIAAEYLSYLKEQRQSHDILMASAGWEAPTGDADLVEAVIAPRSEPALIKMERAWRVRDIESAGNILAVPSAIDGWHLIVNDGWNRIRVLDTTGKTLKQTELQGEGEVVISYLRSAVARDGKRFYAGSSAQGRAVYVYDERFTHVLTYPNASQTHPGVNDLWISDLNQDNSIELYVGFSGIVGLQSVDLSGQRRWIERSIAPVLSLCEIMSGNQRTLLATGASGQIERLDATGQKLSPVMVGKRAIHHIFASAARELRPTQLCGLSAQPNGQLLALGLTPAAEEAWSYPLPVGTFGSQIRFVSSVQILGETSWDWLFAGPDGSIHFIADDGQRHDMFHYGRRLNGLCAVRIEDRTLLVVSTDEGVDGWWLDTVPPSPTEP